MKRISIFISTVAALLAVSCAPDIITPDQSKLPMAGQLTPVITVDQETNYVTFSVKESGVVPIWIFADELIDGKTNKRYSYAQNGISLRFREAGEHSVELKAYNANGISQGSQIVNFTIDNTYRDPFDASPYMKAISNTWTWDADNNGHFGCGETAADPTGWWSCEAHGKDGMGLYDDILTFDAEGNFTQDPGEGGTIFVNWNSGYKPEGHAEEIAAQTDYQAPAEKVVTTYSIESSWNDAGIEEIYLVLPQGQYLSYIPHAKAINDETRYMFIETATSKIKKNLALVHYSATANNGGPIAWKYSFVPFVKSITPEEMLAGTTSEGKVWIMDAGADGHLGCGENGSNPTGWWSAKAYEKKDFGMYDDELTFYPDGKYEFNPGADGKIYVNTGVTAIGSEYNTTGADFDMPYSATTSSYTFDGETITFPAGTIIGYIPNDGFLTDATFHVTEITETSLTGYVFNGSIAWQYKFKARDVKEPEASIGGVEFKNGSAEISVTQGQELAVSGIDLSTIWIDPDYFTLVNDNTLKFNAIDGDYAISKQEGWLKAVLMVDGAPATYEKGKTLWVIGEGIGKPKGASPGWTTGVAADLPLARISEKESQITLYISEPNFKLFGQPDWGMELGGADFGKANLNGYLSINGYPGGASSDNGNIWSGENFAAGWYVITVTDADGKFDIEADQWKVSQTVYDVNGESNLWKAAKITADYWYTGNNDWNGDLTPDAEIGAGNSFTATMPANFGGAEWKGQNKLVADFATSADKVYDFCCTLTANTDCTVTIKLTGTPEAADDVNTFFYDGDIKLTEGEAFTYKREKISQKVGNDNFTLIFDFGRVAEGKTVSASDICFQEHKEEVTVMKKKR